MSKGLDPIAGLKLRLRAPVYKGIRKHVRKVVHTCLKNVCFAADSLTLLGRKRASGEGLGNVCFLVVGVVDGVAVFLLTDGRRGGKDPPAMDRGIAGFLPRFFSNSDSCWRVPFMDNYRQELGYSGVRVLHFLFEFCSEEFVSLLRSLAKRLKGRRSSLLCFFRSTRYLRGATYHSGVTFRSLLETC